jgi:hypothetical protein
MKLNRITTAAAILVPAILALGAAPAVAAGNPGGNNGTIKLSEVGGPEDHSNDPKLPCSFEIQWYGFDAGDQLKSQVSFAGQGADAGVGIEVTGAAEVFIGEDAAGGGSDHDATQVYTLAFDTPAANPTAGYHVKVTTDNGGSKGADTKFKVFHVRPCDGATEPTEPGDTPDPGGVGTTDPSVPTPALVPWSWDWQYAAPACDALTVDYPANIPSGQANDVNIRFATASGQITLNFHHNTGTWAGRTAFTYTDHPQWPTGLSAYDVVWVQVGGTNYHWQGTVACGTPTPAAPAPAPAAPAPAAPAPAAVAPAAVAAAEVSGFRARTETIKRGAAPRADWVTVTASGSDVVRLQQLTKGGWTVSSAAAIREDGTAKVTFPRLSKRGTYQFRVVIDGAATKPLKVRVR